MDPPHMSIYLQVCVFVDAHGGQDSLSYKQCFANCFLAQVLGVVGVLSRRGCLVKASDMADVVMGVIAEATKSLRVMTQDLFTGDLIVFNDTRTLEELRDQVNVIARTEAHFVEYWITYADEIGCGVPVYTRPALK